MKFVSVSPAKYTTLDRDITPTVQDFLIGSKHGYKFCLIFNSWIRLNLPGTTSETQGIRILGHRKMQVIFNTEFSQRV
jgi:hypothetical protein